jgi:hypothetical protein
MEVVSLFCQGHSLRAKNVYEIDLRWMMKKNFFYLVTEILAKRLEFDILGYGVW